MFGANLKDSLAAKAVSIISVFVLVVGVSPAAASATTTDVTICHANNGSGWTQQTVDSSSVNGGGSGDHNSNSHQGGDDIIPPGFWDADGRNWDAEGQAIWNNNCEVPPSVTLTGVSSCVAPDGKYSITWTLTNLENGLQMDITGKDFDGDDNLTDDSNGDSFDDDNGSINANFSSDPVSVGGIATAVTNHDKDSIQRVRLEVDVRWQSHSNDSISNGFQGEQDDVTTIVNYGSPCPTPDTTKPVISSVSDIATSTENSSGTNVSFTAPTATDNKDGSVAVTCVPPSGSNFVIGTTPVICSAQDAAGNVASTTFNVIVSLIIPPAPTSTPTTTPNTAPTIVLNGINPLILLIGEVFNDLGATWNDAEDAIHTGIVYTSDVVNTSVVGTTTVAYSYTDGGSLTASTTRTVVVNAPVATSTPTTTPDQDNDTIPDSTDNCVAIQNVDQLDTDQDGEGDVCDQTPNGSPAPAPAPTVSSGGSTGGGKGHTNKVCSDNVDNDNDGLYDMNDPGCESPMDGSEEDPVGGSAEGEVLGAACGPILNSFLGLRGKANDPEAVKVVQEFLNKELGLSLEVNGDYDAATIEAVKVFQAKYLLDVLTPWGIGDATGIVYLTTQRMINMIACPSLNLPIPDLD